MIVTTEKDCGDLSIGEVPSICGRADVEIQGRQLGTGFGHLEAVIDYIEPLLSKSTSDAYSHDMLQGDCYDKDRPRRSVL